uniref:Uncharacterized protein n=1 Tax=Coturnix japonica TaxID=93934 RepID=A0A8C2U4B6_COTJA
PEICHRHKIFLYLLYKENEDSIITSAWHHVLQPKASGFKCFTGLSHPSSWNYNCAAHLLQCDCLFSILINFWT